MTASELTLGHILKFKLRHCPHLVDLGMDIDRELGSYRLVVQPQDKLKIDSLVTISELIKGQ